jgi:HD-GYP domain-containing protein (c-di-GMP phosphodiesterase class II)
MGMPVQAVDMLVLVGMVHDCGKTGVPSQVLDAPRKLTKTEFEVIKMHTVYAYDALTEFPNMVRHGARGHHEKYGGRGYPDGLAEKEIPLTALITAVSDIYDAMVSQRAYKKPRNPFNIIMWINQLRGRELEPSIVDAFMQNMPKEMLNKKAVLTNNEIAVVHEIDFNNLEYPTVQVGTKIFKTNADLHILQMQVE